LVLWIRRRVFNRLLYRDKESCVSAVRFHCALQRLFFGTDGLRGSVLQMMVLLWLDCFYCADIYRRYETRTIDEMGVFLRKQNSLLYS
jgi:hypothetical protein